jgi:hypothetical protein
LGTAFKVDRIKLNEYLNESEEKLVLFPHVLSKNVVFEMNFGQRVSYIGDEPFAPIKSGFQLIQKQPLEQRVAADPRPASKKDCEVALN